MANMNFPQNLPQQNQQNSILNNNYSTLQNNYAYYPASSASFFPQPQGNVYLINSQAEVSNIPINNNISAAFCPQENSVFLKTLQNGSPVFVGYKLSPLEQDKNISSDDNIIKLLQELTKRVKVIEEQLPKKNSGGKINELL